MVNGIVDIQQTVSVDQINVEDSDMLVLDRPITATYHNGEEKTVTPKPTPEGLYATFDKLVTINPGERVKFTSGGVEKYLMFK